MIAEDVITTGRSVKEVIATIKPYKPKIAGIAALIDRSDKGNCFGKVNIESLKKIKIKTYTQQRCPMCKAGKLLVKHGSRAN